MTDTEGYLPLKALARYSGLSVRTLRSHLSDPVRPLPHYRIGGKVLVRRSDYDAWAAAFRVESGALGRVVDDVMEGLQ
ncbi:MAG: hypothetical protein CL471_03210 [Acidobacteria bacterium]|jgi:hypothetical protein|nr:hypothetical protein [Acidobacteriota bacterium]